MVFGNAALRRVGYVALSLFSIVLLGLCATRIDNTRKSAGTYDPIIAELLAASILTMLWSWVMETGYVSSFRSEMVGGFILWLLLLVGAAIATNKWNNLIDCKVFVCQLLTTIVAFAWITWGTLTLLMLITMLYATVHRGWDEPMHARWAPRGASTY
ncbi:hypothetical protein V5O48_014907 [Marasmius crinis-equi]|uniref:Uncharacterized protein n=1 Tax=Marasmius crinis-equi TaxID=585013 RepID=A0ABR3EW05_9AGAR